MSVASLRRAAAVGMATAGLLHLIHLRTHSEPTVLAFFALTAAAQGTVALLLWKTDRRGPVVAGASLSAGVIALYVATRFVPPPFHLVPEPVDAVGILAKVAETIALGALLAIVIRRPGPQTAQTEGLSRREFLRAGAATAAGVVGGLAVAAVGSRLPAVASPHPLHAAAGSTAPHGGASGGHGNMTVGDVDVTRMGFDPVRFLTQFDYGTVSRLVDGRTLREFRVVAHDREIEIAPGVFFPAWTFNGTVPGPTLRVREGDLVRVNFINAAKHPHTMHFHGIHRSEMDGVPGIGPGEVPPGGTFTYEFEARPFGLHHYHCHTLPLKRHIHKGLYGAFIIDPPQGRPPARELVMVMNGFDTNFDSENEVYAVNTVAFHYAKHPIRVRRNELVRIHLVNMTEFDPVNSIHIHGNFFHVYRTGTALVTNEYTDTIMLCQAERAILEVRFPYAGRFMFHAHQSEFTELGWMGIFEVTEDAV